MTTIAIIQAGTALGSIEKTLEKLDRLAGDAAQKGAKLAVFPEAFIGGYPKAVNFGSGIGFRNSDGRKRYHAYADSAISLRGGEAVNQLREITHKHGMFLVVGAVEREVTTLYNSLIYLAPDGKIMGVHRKLMFPMAERAYWQTGDGSTLPVFDTPLGNLGGLIRWENYMPQARMVMYHQQVEVYCAPTVDDSSTWLPTVQHIAREGGCFVLSSCQYLTHEDYPEGWLEYGAETPNIMIHGGSCLIHPSGNYIIEPVYDRESVLTADIDLDEIVVGKQDFDVIRNFSRPDIFNLNFNSVPLSALTVHQ